MVNQEEALNDLDAKRPLLGISAISSHLKDLNYPARSLLSMARCGEKTGYKILRQCSCTTKLLDITYHCNLRTCFSCSKIRKRRIVKKYLPFLETLPQNRKYFTYFLTISPLNYDNSFKLIRKDTTYYGLEAGLIHIRECFNKFIRTKYIKERLKGGFYVIETKGGAGNWNIHLHIICYGRFLDNKVRRFKDSKLVSLFKSSSGRPVNIHISRQGSSAFTLNYMCKYIGQNKDDFTTLKDMASYIFITHKMRLITSFGDFYDINKRLEALKRPLLCRCCNKPIELIFDLQVISYILAYVPDPPNLENYLN